jgi:hypothetical protein
MHLTLHEIPFGDLCDFLKLLQQENLDDIVVVGGAVRDLLLSQPCNDIDIAVKLQVKSPELVREPDSNAPYDMTSALANVLHPLAVALGVQAYSFYEPLIFKSLTIDVLGLNPIKDSCGQIYPDIFIDVNQRLFNARPELTVNQLILSADANVWPVAGVQDLNNRVGRLTDAPLSIHLRQVLRTLWTCKLLGLTLTYESAKEIFDHLRVLRDPRLFENELLEEDTQQLLDRLVSVHFTKSAALAMSSSLAAIASLVEAYSKTRSIN